MKMNDYIELVNKKLDEFIPVQYPEKIFESMRYSVLAGGKRLRPIMVLETSKMFGADYNDAIEVACAVEMLHCQSLIHDDLPCMDNDDFRRGKPTNHKAFDEATAVLAGDALISFGPQLIIEKSKISSEKKVDVIKEFCKAAGAYGIIAGQVVDIDSEGKPLDIKTLEYIHTHKTADLFVCALKCGAIVAGADEKQLSAMENFGQALGFAFQICDDILDEISTFEVMGKTMGKDKNAQKLTYTALYGLDEAKLKVDCLLNNACGILNEHGLKSEIFEEIINGIRERANS